MMLQLTSGSRHLYGTFLRLTGLLLLLLGLASCSSATGGAGNASWQEIPLKASALPPAQMNIAAGSHSWVYANVLRASEAWVLSDTPLSPDSARTAAQQLPIRPDGWPASLPAGYYLWLNTAGYPTGSDSSGTTFLHGVWVLTWEGSGTVRFATSENNGSGETTLLDDSTHGRVVKLITTPRKYPVIYVRSTSSSDPVRNVKLWAPAHDGAGLELTSASELGRGRIAGSLEPLPGAAEPVFHPAFLNHIREAGHGIPLRMMSFLKINQDPAAWGNGTLDWSDRGDASYAFGSLSVCDAAWTRHEVAGYRQKLGTPYEHLIDLCNITGNDLWIQVPHNASEGLIRNLARLIAGRGGHPGLNNGLRVWFEFSNEIWNGSSAYLAQFNKATAVAAEHFGVEPQAVSTAQRGWGSGRLQGQALAFFEDEWAKCGMTDDRLINVVAGFTLSPEYNRAVLSAVREINPALPETLAISNYFGYESSREIFALYDWSTGSGNWSSDLISKSTAALRRNLYSTSEAWTANDLAAAEAGVQLISYEGGQHLLPVGLGDSSDPAFRNFMDFLEYLQRSTVMQELYTEQYALWTSAGGRTVSLFADVGLPSYWGYWGAKEWLTETRATARKWDAFLSWIETMDGVRALHEPLAAAPQLADRSIRGEAGTPLTAVLQAGGGDGTTAVTMIAGRLPQGLLFSAGNDGNATISGTPTTSATTSIIVRALDRDRDPAYRVYTIQIDPAGTGSNAFLYFDGAAIPATVQASGLKNGRYDPVRAYEYTDETRASLCMPFSIADGSALFSTEYTDKDTTGVNTIPAVSQSNMYGGWCVTQLQTGTGGACETSYTNLRDGRFLSWSGANCSDTGYPTTLDLFLVWRKDQFTDSTDTAVFSFGDDVATAALRVDFTDLIAGGDNKFRFAVLEGETWYLSEASYTQQVVGDGYLEVTGFNGSAAPGKRWAVITPGRYDVAIPDRTLLSFNAQRFSDIRAVAVVYHGRSTGYHYNVGFRRFFVLGRTAPAGN